MKKVKDENWESIKKSASEATISDYMNSLFDASLEKHDRDSLVSYKAKYTEGAKFTDAELNAIGRIFIDIMTSIRRVGGVS